MFIKSFSLFLSLLPLQQFFVFRNIWQTNLVWSNRTSFVSFTFNKSKFLHWDLHLLWASTVYVCFFLATSRTAKFRADNNFTPTVEDVKSLSNFAVIVSFTSNFPLPRDMAQLSWISFKIVIRACTTGLTKEWLARSQFSIILSKYPWQEWLLDSFGHHHHFVL